MANNSYDDGDWHLDKKVPIGLLIMIVIQTMALVYVGTTWKSDIDHRLISLEKSDNSKSLQGDRIIVLEQQFGFITDSLRRIEHKIDSKEKP
ncbi:MAG: hypothetical protein ABJA10_00105 [Aestuariivirga sp.]